MEEGGCGKDQDVGKKRMKEYPQIKSLKEAKLLLGTENRYGIYQNHRRQSPAENMNLWI